MTIICSSRTSLSSSLFNSVAARLLTTRLPNLNICYPSYHLPALCTKPKIPFCLPAPLAKNWWLSPVPRKKNVIGGRGLVPTRMSGTLISKFFDWTDSRPVDLYQGPDRGGRWDSGARQFWEILSWEMKISSICLLWAKVLCACRSYRARKWKNRPY